MFNFVQTTRKQILEREKIDPGCQIQKCLKSNMSQLQILVLGGFFKKDKDRGDFFVSLGDFFWISLRGLNGLSVRRARRTKSSRPEGSPILIYFSLFANKK